MAALATASFRLARGAAVAAAALALSGCDFVVLFPAGDVAAQQRALLVASTALMLLIILPVIALTLAFAWRYRASNAQATYDPDWHHSTQLEVLIWSAPLVIIIALGALTMIGTHTLDPYRALARLGAKRPLPQDARPLVVEAVALDWKWLFIYPEQGVAAVNELAAPVDRPVQFRITASTVMNAFSVPAMAGMIYAMPGMQTQLHAVVNREGEFQGLSSHYSGSGFSRMTFRMHGQSPQAFDQWVAKAKGAGATLSRDAYLDLEKPTENAAVRYFSGVEEGLFGRILKMCVAPGTPCVDETMRLDARRAAAAGHEDRGPPSDDKRRSDGAPQHRH